MKETRWRQWGWTVLAAGAFIAVVAWIARSTFRNATSNRFMIGTLTDFRDAVYYPVVALIDGVNPYHPSHYFASYPVGQEFPVYSPVHLFVHLPYEALSLETARTFNFWITVGLIVLLAWTALHLAGRRPNAATTLAVATAVMLCEPGRLNLRNGQATIIYVLGAYLALAARNAWFGGGGLVLALGKPTFGLPLAVVMWARRQWPSVWRGAVIALIVSLPITIALVDAAGGIREFADSIRIDLEVTNRAEQSAIGSVVRVDAANSLARLTGLRPSETVATLFGLVLLAIGTAAVYRLRRLGTPLRNEIMVTLSILTTFVCIYRLIYDTLLILWPLALLLGPPSTEGPRFPRWPRLALAALLLFPMLDPLRRGRVRNILGTEGFFFRFWGGTVSGLCLLTAWAICVFIAWRMTQRTTEASAATASQ